MFRHVKFAELPVVDQGRAVAFYRDALGLQVGVDDSSQGAWRWIELKIPGAKTRLLLTKREGEPRQEPALVLVADDVGAAHEMLTSRGVVFTQPPAPAPWSGGETYALFRDSEGNIVMLASH